MWDIISSFLYTITMALPDAKSPLLSPVFDFGKTVVMQV
jgi:hypothetical protein